MSILKKFNDCKDFKHNRDDEDGDLHGLLLSDLSEVHIKKRQRKKRIFSIIGMTALLCINLFWSLKLVFISIRAKRIGPSLIHCESVFLNLLYYY